MWYALLTIESKFLSYNDAITSHISTSEKSLPFTEKNLGKFKTAAI